MIYDRRRDKKISCIVMFYLLKQEGDAMCDIIDRLELNEAIWRNHYQIITAAEDDVDCINPQFS